MLVRTGCVHRVFLVQYPEVDGGGWYIDVDHSDPGQSRQLHTKLGQVRHFKTADAAVRTVQASGYTGQLVLTLTTSAVA